MPERLASKSMRSLNSLLPGDYRLAIGVEGRSEFLYDFMAKLYPAMLFGAMLALIVSDVDARSRSGERSLCGPLRMTHLEEDSLRMIARDHAMISDMEASKRLEPKFLPVLEDGVFIAGSPTAVRVDLANSSKDRIETVCACTWKTDNIAHEKILHREDAAIDLAGNESCSRMFEFIPSAPGFYRVGDEMGAYHVMVERVR